MISYDMHRRIKDAAYRKYRLGYTIDDIAKGYERFDEEFLLEIKRFFPKEVKDAIDKWKSNN